VIGLYAVIIGVAWGVALYLWLINGHRDSPAAQVVAYVTAIITAALVGWMAYGALGALL
jgi:hypothetical protein